ncbi:MAG: metal-sensing transcriptional repressor [Tissierellia bacterium]|nr:metal-sensing transcriptional repressor [Tissierellia bacterium]
MQADKGPILQKLKTARGQLDGIIRMVEEDKYCVDISNQILAAQALLKSSNREILRAHLDHCVYQSFASEEAKEEKIEEIQKILDRLMK